LEGKILHDSYPSPALKSYWKKIHRYAELEARQRLIEGAPSGNCWLRAFGKLGWMLLFRRGLLHGPRAWIWIGGQAYQEWLTTAATGRLRRASGAGTVPSSLRTGDRHAL
jgi:hypothetical protein